jgi:hypothetical protein
MNSEKTFSGTELEAAMESGELKAKSYHVMGMVKASKKKGYIQFTATHCEDWLDIPVSIIEEAELLGQTQCKDHQHPLFKLMLQKPNDEFGKAVLSILAQFASRSHPAAAQNTQNAVPPRAPKGPQIQPYRRGLAGSAQTGHGGISPGTNAEPLWCCCTWDSLEHVWTRNGFKLQWVERYMCLPCEYGCGCDAHGPFCV